MIIVYSLETETVMWELPTSPALKTFYLISDELIILDMQLEVRAFAPSDDAPLFALEGIIDIAFDVDKELMALSVGTHNEGEVHLYRLPNFEPMTQTFAYQGFLSRIALSHHDYGMLAITDNDNGIRVYDIESGDNIMTAKTNLEYDGSEFESSDEVAFSPDGTQLLVQECTVLQNGCWEITMMLFDIASGDKLLTEIFDYGVVQFIEINDDAMLIISSPLDRVLAFIEVNTLTMTPLPLGIERVFNGDSVAINQTMTLLSVFDYANATESFYRVYAVID